MTAKDPLGRTQGMKTTTTTTPLPPPRPLPPGHQRLPQPLRRRTTRHPPRQRYHPLPTRERFAPSPAGVAAPAPRESSPQSCAAPQPARGTNTQRPTPASAQADRGKGWSPRTKTPPEHSGTTRDTRCLQANGSGDWDTFHHHHHGGVRGASSRRREQIPRGNTAVLTMRFSPSSLLGGPKYATANFPQLQKGHTTEDRGGLTWSGDTDGRAAQHRVEGAQARETRSSTRAGCCSFTTRPQTSATVACMGSSSSPPFHLLVRDPQERPTLHDEKAQGRDTKNASTPRS